MGDVVAITLLQRTHWHVLGQAHASGQGDEAEIGEGWLTVIAALPVLQHAG